MMLSEKCSVLWGRGLRAVMLGVLLSLFWGRGVAGEEVSAGEGSVVGVRGAGRLGCGMEWAVVLNLVPSTSPETCGNKNGWIAIQVTNGTGPFQYSINGGPWQTLDTFYNLAGGVYNVAAEEIANPANQGTIGVALGSIPGPSAILQPINATCTNNDGQIDVIILTGTPPFLYSANGGPFVTNNLIGGLASGSNSITIKDNNGCLVTQSTNVGFTDNLTLAMGPGATICQGTSSTLTLTTNAGGFNWTPAATLNKPTDPEPVASPGSTTRYTVAATLGICMTTGTETITVLPAPQPTATPVAIICYGQSTQLQGSGGVTYQWSPATYLSGTTIPNPVVQQPQKSITYSLNVTDVNGCKSIQPATILVVVTPQPNVFAGDDTAILVGQTLPLDAVDVNNSGFTSYQWSPVLGLDNPSIRDPVATVTGDITYVVTAMTPVGCTGTDSIRIKAVTMSDIVVPNAFTPNGDGRNDVLRPHAIGIKDFKSFKVFNRWGQLVFSTEVEGAGWDGSVGGQVQPMGTYVWMVVGVDFSGKMVERRGTVILVR